MSAFACVRIGVSVLLSVYRPMQDGKFMKHMRKQNAAEKKEEEEEVGMFESLRWHKVAPSRHRIWSDIDEAAGAELLPQ